MRATTSDGDPRFAFPDDGRWALTWEDLRTFRHRGGLPGHAEMAGKTLFFKANTGPSGHGLPFAAGQALALKMAGAEEVKVFAVEGEGGLTPGATHETLNSAFGLGLSNLVLLIDWNDFGIDERPASTVVYGGPEDWVAPHGWRVVGTPDGMSWGPVTRTVLDVARGDNLDRRPSAAWFRTQKGRGYGKVDAASHGTPHPLNSPAFWAGRRTFMDRYGVTYEGVDQPAPADPAARAAQAEANLRTAMSVLRRDPALVTWLSDRLLAIAATVPDQIPGVRLGRPESAGVFSDPRLTDARSYPAAVFKAPGERAPNRAALGTWGAWVNAIARHDYGRPLFVVASADLAESTNIAGFGKDFGEQPGFGWYERDANPTGAVLPQEITEFANAGIVAGMASVNFAEDPFNDFDGFWGACSTYASFSYLKYGPMRLFSQLAQDADLRRRPAALGGRPLRARDRRGFAHPFRHLRDRRHPALPERRGHRPAPLGAQRGPGHAGGRARDRRPDRGAPPHPARRSRSRTARPSGCRRTSRPPGAPTCFAPTGPGLPRMGTVFVRGTVTTANLVSILSELDARGLNVKVVAALSPQLFARQDAAYRDATASTADRWDAMAITNGAFRLMADWLSGPAARDYSLSADWDDRWRTGGSVDEVADEAHLSAAHILAAIERFATEREARRATLRAVADTVGRD